MKKEIAAAPTFGLYDLSKYKLDFFDASDGHFCCDALNEYGKQITWIPVKGEPESLSAAAMAACRECGISNHDQPEILALIGSNDDTPMDELGTYDYLNTTGIYSGIWQAQYVEKMEGPRALRAMGAEA